MDSTPAEAEAKAKAELEALAQAQADAAAAGTTPPWVLLSCLPRLRTAGLFVKQVDLELAPPPSISVLTLSTCLFGDTSTTLPAGRRCPYVVAVDPSGGAILLSDDHVSDAGALPNPRRYILCNAVSRTASALPVPVAYGLPGSIGVVRRQGTSNFGGRLMVAVLTPRVCEDMATLSYRTPKTEDSWTTVELVCMRPYNTKRWGNHGAVALGGSLWWIDLARGLLTSNVFARDKKVHFVHLPPGCALPETTTDDDILLDIHKRRCVKLSDGKLRFVEIHQPGGVATITLWTLNGVDGGHHWACDHNVPFSEIWAEAEVDPVLALIHPYNPAVVYLWRDARLVAIDLSTKIEMKSSDYFTQPPRIHAWELPPPLHGQLHGGTGCLDFITEMLSVTPPIANEDDDEEDTETRKATLMSLFLK